MAAYTGRPSKVDGLIIWGEPGHYQLYAERPGDHPLKVESGPANRFRTVRDANAAALRLADVLPWGTDGLMDAVKARDHQELRVAMVEGLTGRTIAEIQAEDAERRAREQAHYDGTGARDFYNAHLRDLGHEVTWKRKGKRTFHGRCANCGETFRSSYSSMSDTFHRSGPQRPCQAAQPYADALAEAFAAADT